MYINIYPRASQMASTQIILVLQCFCLNTIIFMTRTILELLCSLNPQWIRWKWSRINDKPTFIHNGASRQQHHFHCNSQSARLNSVGTFAMNRANGGYRAEYTKAVVQSVSRDLTIRLGEETHTHTHSNTQITVLCCLVKRPDTCAGSYSIFYGGQENIWHFVEGYKGTETSSKVRRQISESCRVRLGYHIPLA